MNAVGSKVYVNWYGHVVCGTVADRAAHKFEGATWKEWVPILMTIPGSDGKPILPGCESVCAYHQNSVYNTSEAAAAAWADYQQRWNQRRQQATQLDVKPEPVQAVAPQSQPADKKTADELLAEHRAFLQAHWNHERNHLDAAYLEESYQLFRRYIAKKLGYHEAAQPAAKPLEPAAPVQPEPAEPTAMEPVTQPEPVQAKPEKPRQATVRVRRKKKEQESKYIQLSLFD